MSTPAERKARDDFNEFQYQAHIAQEQRQREKAQRISSGRGLHPAAQARIQRHNTGNFWFGGGDVPSTHNVVGRNRDPSRPVIHSLTSSDRGVLLSKPSDHQGRASSTSPPRTSHEHSFIPGASSQPDRPAEIILRTKTPPPSRREVALRTPQMDGDATAGQCAAGQSPQASFSPRPTTPVAASGMSAARSPGASRNPLPASYTAPFAEHYDADALYDVRDEAVEDKAIGMLQFDRNGLPRGRNGIDFDEGQARAAQRVAEDMRARSAHDFKKHQQRIMRADLDALVAIRKAEALRERQRESSHVFGYTLPLGSDPHSRQRQRVQRAAIERTWDEQRVVTARKRAEEDAYYSHRENEEEDWESMRQSLDDRLQAAKPISADSSKEAWLKAWQEHQVAVGEEKRQEMKQRKKAYDEYMSPDVLNYADRIILAERQKKEAQEKYRQQLDEQVRERQYKQRSLVVDNFNREKKFQRPPFTVMPSSFA